eukprot:6272742-Prymnesium_polylepis.1
MLWLDGGGGGGGDCGWGLGRWMVVVEVDVRWCAQFATGFRGCFMRSSVAVSRLFRLSVSHATHRYFCAKSIRGRNCDRRAVVFAARDGA